MIEMRMQNNNMFNFIFGDAPRKRSAANIPAEYNSCPR